MTENNISKVSQYVSVYKEKIENNGEDAMIRVINDKASLIGVFDGLGGSGAKKYHSANMKTGAYLSSRFVSTATKHWFEQICSDNFPGNRQALLKTHIKAHLQTVKEAFDDQQKSKLKSKLSKEFPSTCAIAVCRPAQSGEIDIELYWAGDSRCYLLDDDGLHQLTTDDIDSSNALDNISDDGRMNNIITLSSDFRLNNHHLRPKGPFFIFSATDGCFGYISTPMQFELRLLRNLEKSQNVASFEKNLFNTFEEVAEDDFSLSGLFYCFRSFDEIKERFRKRRENLGEEIRKLQHADRKAVADFWNNSYKDNYYRYAPKQANDVSVASAQNRTSDSNSMTKPSAGQNRVQSKADRPCKESPKQ
ncbi:MAG: protein phosphatase 2C domain-containing protein [Succinivibrionaceae bacterium]|nr:protein phosphatase 2C domain-containing protein [Succinivibrionaceae bacterium]